MHIQCALKELRCIIHSTWGRVGTSTIYGYMWNLGNNTFSLDCTLCVLSLVTYEK